MATRIIIVFGVLMSCILDNANGDAKAVAEKTMSVFRKNIKHCEKEIPRISPEIPLTFDQVSKVKFLLLDT